MYNRVVLDNGLRIITSPMPHSRSVCLAVLVGAGSCYESDQEAGISHFVEHLLFKGTQRRPTAKEISEAIEGLGGILNGSTDKEATVLWCKVPSPRFPVALDVLSDMLLDSRFDARDIEQERQVIMEEIKMNLDLPQQRVDMLIDKLLWPAQPLGREVIGYKETVSAIAREQLLGYVARRYVPNNSVLSIAGDIRHEEAMAQIQPLFDKWAASELPSNYPTDDNQTEARVSVDPKDIEQAHLCLAVHGFSYSHPQRFSIDLLNTVLGGGMSSRLFIEIRERRGLAYDIHSSTDHFRDTGALTIYAGVDPRKVEIALVSILEELSKVRRGVTMGELTRAKELSKGRLCLRFEDSQNVALWYGIQELLMRQILDIDDVISVLDAITVDELRDVAGKILTDSGLNLAITGPVSEEKNLRQLLKLQS
jgi:predicted Zn-dependent peptidase